jgi:hypothetical protein
LGDAEGEGRGDVGAADVLAVVPGDVLLELKNGLRENRDAEFL